MVTHYQSGWSLTPGPLLHQLKSRLRSHSHLHERVALNGPSIAPYLSLIDTKPILRILKLLNMKYYSET